MTTETVRVNGRDVEVGSGTTVASLVEGLGFDTARVAVELNGEICPKARLGETVLRGGDYLEIVSFVGGG